MANAITSCRIILSIVLLFFSTSSESFFIIYIITGFTDILDGIIARKFKFVTNFGSVFDTFGDIVFSAVYLIKILPMFNISLYMWIWLFTVAFIKVFNIVLGFISQNKFVSIHTSLNKITGVLVFILPLLHFFLGIECIIYLVLFISTIAAVQEGYLVYISQ
ncbi:CDP-alcohol phosphatidyltransferase family protein [Liquorilactobacillus hordei]|uniref:CDP-alcohol phosphatidyltransferase family protein n=1 Tax=Liquorilactobacillus hordei TaxID=468911 RepID=UPI001CBD69E4|nr:CDP-alcohol phosphatidyltransferase family protein [Liquorilactobacillus hordei]MBZ2405102.1 phosphatidylglycerophosphate synthase [Liquorilactobacillus hordei]